MTFRRLFIRRWKRAKIAPTKPHSIYAWFVGLPLGILIILSGLTIFLWKVAIPAYVVHREEQEAEKVAEERRTTQEQIIGLAAAEQKRLEKEALQAHEVEKRRLENEAQKAKESAEIERKRLEQEAERNKEELRLQAEQEKRLAKERAEERQRQREQEEVEARIEAEMEAERLRLQEIENDHKAILAYLKANIRRGYTHSDFIWETPVSAVTVRVSGGRGVFGALGQDVNDGDDFVAKQGQLYRLQGKLHPSGPGGVGGKPESKTFSYYFLVSAGQVIRWQEANSGKALAMCKALKETKPQDKALELAALKAKKPLIRQEPVRAPELPQLHDLRFDGKTYISTKVERFAPVTLELWVCPEKPTVAEPGARVGENPAQGIVGSDIPGTSGIGIILRYDSSSDSPLIFAQYLPSGGHNEVSTNTRLPVGKWSHLAAVFGRNQTTVYLNGKQIGHGQPSLNGGGTPFVVGKIGKDNPRYWFTGKIRSVRISKGETYTKEFVPEKVLEKDDTTVFMLDGKRDLVGQKH